MQLQVKNSPFDEKQAELLNQLLPMLTETQQIWLGGYLSAIPTGSKPQISGSTAVQEVPASVTEVTILYGSQTGNGQALAEDFSKKLKAQNFQVTLASMSDFKPKTLKKLENLLLIVSTQGEGDPPDNALPFYEFVFSKRAPKLDQLSYSVLSLGDSSYDSFCETGKQFDARLLELGAKQMSPRIDCDLDYDDPAAEWFASVTSKLTELQEKTGGISNKQAAATLEVVEKSTYSRTNPFQAEVLENINLNGRGSNKETRHLELSLEGSHLEFEPGDSLAIYPENDSVLVDSLIAEMGWDAATPIQLKNDEIIPLEEALRKHYEITVLTKPLLQKLALLSSNNNLKELLHSEQTEAWKEYSYGRDLLDVVRDFGPWDIPAVEFVSILRKIPARQYSIASSFKANPDEVHLTIGTVRYEAHGRIREGVCSGQCAIRTEPGDTLPVYVQRNDNFRLPDDPDTPLIMVGPGTGVAPFRAFLEEWEEIDASGKTWLFFGNQHFVTDFLYQVEWQRWLKEGVLTRMDVAFSRDTDEKVYVQHRMLERSQELFQWLEEGAVIYVCGDEKHMATDVHATLLKIIEKESGMSAEEAADYLAKLQQQKRYQRDVY
ncbi:assimilatory sulfite reductase (NADPH) flavoprotein subunit [Oceanobacillus caeni]|uniref:assimilatory sulfite reductase (NADPH) flavoprotein subunit n=1 Tax=Oceanobacillus caeni TaxID=405946 RepID=UPI00195A8BAC|nr:assimilatory sulfite reductase (NADPH) flavoprotein subunit [Oceanobacillus caeni]MCR1835542.1 assimilatory sulfite reductase (NADPH) flavoprotein subunit [Oceanobacillus caeni]